MTRVSLMGLLLDVPTAAAGGAGVEAALVSIAGTVTDGVTPVEGVLMTFGAYNATTAADGTYTIANVPTGTTADLIPSKTGYLFVPESVSLTTSSILGNLTGQDFTPYALQLYAPFSTPASAPLGTYAATVGTLQFTDAGNILSVANDTLVANGTASGTTGFIQSDAIARAAGRASLFFINAITATGIGRFGLNTSLGSGMTHRILMGTAGVFVQDGTEHLEPCTYPETITFVQRSTGAFLLVGTRLAWVYRTGTGADKPTLWFGSGQSPNLSFISLLTADLVSMNADSKVYTAFEASPADGVTATMEANAIVDFEWTPATNETLTILFRRTDDDNTLKLVCDQAAGTIKLYKRLSGSDTELTGGTTTHTWTASTLYRVTIIAEGTSIRTFVTGAAKNAPAAQTDQQNATGVKVTGFTTGANLYCWKTNLSALIPEFMTPTVPARYYFVVGDSKSSNNVWQGKFEALVGTPTADWTLVGNHASPGWSANTVAGNIDAYLATLDATPAPEFCAVNLGTNDVNGDSPNDVFYNDADQDGAEWTAKLQYILDAVHTKWADCQVYVMRPWKPDNGGSFQTKLDLINDTLIPNAIAGRAWAHLGPDERVFLENNDNGATYISVDGIHPNTAGYQLTAEQWASTFGL